MFNVSHTDRQNDNMGSALVAPWGLKRLEKVLQMRQYLTEWLGLCLHRGGGKGHWSTPGKKMGRNKETQGQAQVRFGRNLGESKRSREGNKAGCVSPTESLPYITGTGRGTQGFLNSSVW